MARERGERLARTFQKLAAEFLKRESRGTTLITVTGATLSKDLRHANLLVSVYPDDNKTNTLSFLRKKRESLRGYIAAKTKMKFLPVFNFLVDHGPKEEERIEKLLSQIKKEQK